MPQSVARVFGCVVEAKSVGPACVLSCRDTTCIKFVCILGEIPKFTFEGMTLQNKTARLEIVRIAVSKTVKQRKL